MRLIVLGVSDKLAGQLHSFWACSEVKCVNIATKVMKSRIAFGGREEGGGATGGPRDKTDSPKAHAQGITSSK